MPSQPILDAIESFKRRRTERAGKAPPSVDALRESFAPAGKRYPMPADVKVTSTTIASFPAYWLDAPGVRTDRVVLFLHGGGYALGSLASHGELAARIGRSAGARVLFLEYPLTPEHPFPAPVDATLAAWRELASKGEVAPLDARSVALAGDSAGGGLAVALMQILRDEGAPLPACAALMSPAVDLALSGESMTDRVDRDPIFAPPMLRKIAKDYLAGADPKTPRASPLFGSLAGLPPLLVQVGTEELIFSDADRLANAAIDAKVHVTYDVGVGLFHVYQSVADAPEAVSATTQIGEFMRSHGS